MPFSPTLGGAKAQVAAEEVFFCATVIEVAILLISELMLKNMLVVGRAAHYTAPVVGG